MHRKLHSILLVDDNFLTNTHNEKILDNLCIADHIIIAENAEEALDYLERCRKNNTYPEIIFVEINLPEKNGWELIEGIRKLHFEKRRSPAYVILTSSDRIEDELSSFGNEHIIGFLKKPLSEKLVLDMMELYSMRESYPA